jgi:hypothetical protein
MAWAKAISRELERRDPAESESYELLGPCIMTSGNLPELLRVRARQFSR